MYEYLIVGTGFYGSICAHQLAKAGKKILVIDSRKHIGGNCYTENKDAINVHEYGPHIFHTSNEEVWKWINQFVEFNNFTLRIVANYKGEIYALPFNMWTFNQLWGVNTPEEAQKIIEEQAEEGQFVEADISLREIELIKKVLIEKLINSYHLREVYPE